MESTLESARADLAAVWPLIETYFKEKNVPTDSLRSAVFGDTATALQYINDIPAKSRNDYAKGFQSISFSTDTLIGFFNAIYKQWEGQVEERFRIVMSLIKANMNAISAWMKERYKEHDFGEDYVTVFYKSPASKQNLKSLVATINSNIVKAKWTTQTTAEAWNDILGNTHVNFTGDDKVKKDVTGWVMENLPLFMEGYYLHWFNATRPRPEFSAPPESKEQPTAVPSQPKKPKKAPAGPTTISPPSAPKQTSRPIPVDEAKFKDLIQKIKANKENLKLHYTEGFDFALAYAEETISKRRTFEQEVKVITNNIDTQSTKQEAIEAWRTNLKRGKSTLFESPDDEETEAWVRKHLVHFLDLYYTGWEESSKVPLAPKKPPAKTAPPPVTPQEDEPPKGRIPSGRPKVAPVPTRKEKTTSESTTSDEEPSAYEQEFVLPKRGGVYNTVEELKLVTGLLERQDAFPSLDLLSKRAESIRNACFGPRWIAVYEQPNPKSVIPLSGVQTESAKFKRKPTGPLELGEDVFLKSSDALEEDGTAKTESLQDIVVGTRLNLLLQAKLLRGFVRMIDWYMCRGEMTVEKTVNRNTVTVKEERARVFTLQEKAPESLANLVIRIGTANALLSGVAQLCLALESAQNLLEYVHYDMHPDNVNVKISSEPDPPVLEFNRPYSNQSHYVDLRDTGGNEVKIIDYGRNRMRSSYVFGDTPNEVIFSKDMENLGISGRFHPQFDMRLYVIGLVHKMADESTKIGVKFDLEKLERYELIVNMLDALSGSKHVRTKKEDIESESKIYRWNGKNVAGGEYGLWANCVFNYSNQKITGNEARKKEYPEVEKVLEQFQTGGLKYLYKATQEEARLSKPSKSRKPIERVNGIYLPTAWKLICFWAWTPMTWDGPTPSMILEDEIFNFLRESPSDPGRVVKAVEYRSMQDFKLIGEASLSIGGPHGDWWPRLKSYWDSLPPQPQIQLEDFPDFYQIFAVNRILSHGSEGLLFEIEDLNPTVLGKQKRVLKLLPTIAFGREEYTRMLVNEARVHATIDKICVATPEFFGIFRIPVQPLRKLALGYDGALLQWDPSGKLSKETHMIAMIMEYIEGETLKTYIHNTLQNGQTLDETGLTAIALPLALQVKCLHDAGVVHRDLHMSNIMVDTEHQHQVRLIDFGMATSTEDPERFLKEGNWTYVPPEARGKNQFLTFWKKSDIDFKKMDVYSLGMILLKAGNPEAFKTEEIDDPFEYFPPKKMIPDSPYLSALVSRMLHPDPDKRPNIDTVIGTIVAAKPEFSETGEWYSWWNNVKVSAQRMWSLLLGSKENVKRQKHEDRRSLNRSRSPIRPHRQ